MIDAKRFEIHDEKGRLSGPSLDLTLFSKEMPDMAAESLAVCLRQLATVIGEQLGYYSKNDMKGFEQADAGTLEAVAGELEETNFTRTPMFTFSGHSGRAPKDIHTPAVEFEIYAVGTVPPSHFLRVAFPWTEKATTLDEFKSLAIDLARRYPYSSGYAGFSVFWNSLEPTRSRGFLKEYGGWLLRHKGMIHGVPSDLSPAAVSGIVDVNWLTFLREDEIERSVGKDGLGKILPSGVSFDYVEGGKIVLQAGQAPVIGDVNRNEQVELYDALARVLEPLFAPRRVRAGTWIEGLSRDDRTRWMNRHFD